jgi:hypothetical protein
LDLKEEPEINGEMSKAFTGIRSSKLLSSVQNGPYFYQARNVIRET